MMDVGLCGGRVLRVEIKLFFESELGMRWIDVSWVSIVSIIIIESIYVDCVMWIVRYSIESSKNWKLKLISGFVWSESWIVVRSLLLVWLCLFITNWLYLIMFVCWIGVYWCESSMNKEFKWIFWKWIEWWWCKWFWYYIVFVIHVELSNVWNLCWI